MSLVGPHVVKDADATNSPQTELVAIVLLTSFLRAISLRADSLAWVPRTGEARKSVGKALGCGSPSKPVSLLAGYRAI